MIKKHNSQVDLSNKVAKLKLAQEIAENTPENRSDVVKEVKAEIAKGRFRIDSEAVAEKILQNILIKS